MKVNTIITLLYKKIKFFFIKKIQDSVYFLSKLHIILLVRWPKACQELQVNSNSLERNQDLLEWNIKSRQNVC